MRRIALLPALLLTGVCHAGLFTDDEAQRKISELQQSNTQQQTRLDERFSGLENTQRAQGLEMLSQMDALKAEISKMRGQLEVQAHDIETIQKRQRDLYVDVDTRLRQLESAAAAVPPPPPVADNQPRSGKDKKLSAKPVVAAAAVPASTPAQTAEADPAQEVKTYDAAFNLFRGGNYQGALAAFQAFNQAYPKSPLAPSAHYWIGNSYFNLKDFKSAIASQQELISLYPKSPKVPDALLNISSSQQGMGDMGSARKTLEDLLARFPLSDAADKAKYRLENMK
ncbi:MAG: tol-pal system protein YbgF [Sulfuricella denitrificans]|nr:tol-pal system protein YbgF [Sulfuricella denitrificans]